MAAESGRLDSDPFDQLDSPGFSGRLWRLFRGKIFNIRSNLQEVPGCSADTVMQIIGEWVKGFFIFSLERDAFAMQLACER